MVQNFNNALYIPKQLRVPKYWGGLTGLGTFPKSNIFLLKASLIHPAHASSMKWKLVLIQTGSSLACKNWSKLMHNS